jgi:hypothetical protein
MKAVGLAVSLAATIAIIAGGYRANAQRLGHPADAF